MPNTLTGLIPTLYAALNIVSREMVGLIPAVRRDSNAERAAKDQVVRVPIGAAGDMEDIVPGAAPAATGDTTVGYADITIAKSKSVPIRWNGEEQKAIGTAGVFNQVLADQFSEAMRKLINAIEVDLAAAGAAGASRAIGTAGTAPFATKDDFSDFATVAKLLDDDGCPKTDRQLALNSASMVNLRGKQSSLWKVNEAGSAQMLLTGLFDRIQGFAIRDSAGFALHTKGVGASYITNLGAPLAAGALDIAVDTGSGAVLDGDVVSFAGDSNLYIVKKGITAAGSLSIGKPGLRAALADGVAMTVGGSFTPNLAFDRNAIILAARAPAVPDGGDSADDAMTITDPVTGLTFEVRVYRQYRQVKYEVCLAWGVAVVKPEHVAVLLG